MRLIKALLGLWRLIQALWGLTRLIKPLWGLTRLIKALWGLRRHTTCYYRPRCNDVASLLQLLVQLWSKLACKY